MAEALGEEVVRICHKCYESIPLKGAKPRTRTDGRREWTVLSGLLLKISEDDRAQNPQSSDSVHLIVLATGVKCSPIDACSPHGDRLHDCHAEILVRRAARRWFLRRLSLESQSDGIQSPDLLEDLPRIFVPVNGEGRWRLKPSVQVIWYISTLPCGDASTSYLRTRRDLSDRVDTAVEDDAKPSTTAVPNNLTDETHHSLGPSIASRVVKGRATMSKLSTLRTKPGRADSLPAVSHSCSDKLASYCALGLQGTLLSSILQPIMPATFVIGFEPVAYSSAGIATEGQALERDCRRALWDRLQGVQPAESISTSEPPKIVMMARTGFAHSKEVVENQARLTKGDHVPWQDVEPVPAAGSLIWTRTESGRGIVENVVAGVKMGASSVKKKGQEALPLHQSRRSALCKLDWFREINKTIKNIPKSADESDRSYYVAKHDPSNRYAWEYRRRKLVLRGWPPDCPNGTESTARQQEREAIEQRLINTFVSGSDLPADEAGEMARSLSEDEGTAPIPHPRAPFAGWLTLGRRGESFSLQGLLSDTTATPSMQV